MDEIRILDLKVMTWRQSKMKRQQLGASMQSQFQAVRPLSCACMDGLEHSKMPLLPKYDVALDLPMLLF